MSRTIFTSEPMLNRALAAEIRHRPTLFTTLLRGTTGPLAEWGTLAGIRCEGTANVDIELTFRSGTVETRVGIESKLDHALSEDQIARERTALDHLFLLVLDQIDAEDFRDRVDGVITWSEAIGCFPDSRLTVADIDDLPPQKVQAERLLRAARRRHRSALSDQWQVWLERGGSGMPAIAVQSPRLPAASDSGTKTETPTGRRLRGQIQVVGRSMPARLEDIRFEYHVGIEVALTPTDYPKADTTEVAPTWMGYLESLGTVLSGADPAFRVREGKLGTGKTGVGRNKAPLVKKFLNGKPWLAAGYTDWALGVKSAAVSVSEVDGLVEEAFRLFATWFDDVT